MNTEKILSLWRDWKIADASSQTPFNDTFCVSKTISGEEIKRNVKVISVPKNTSDIEKLKEQNIGEEEIKSQIESVINSLITLLDINQKLSSKDEILSVKDYKILPKEGKIGYDVFIMQDYLPTLESKLKSAKLTEEEIIALGADISEALKAIHSEKICHGDVTTSNIYVSPAGKYKLGSIGITAFLSSKKCGASYAVNTDYAAPEAIKEKKFSPRSDIYSLGSVLFKAVNGAAPFLPLHDNITSFERKNALQQKLDGEEIPIPQCKNKFLFSVITKACDPNPQNRFEGAKAFKDALGQGDIKPANKETSPIVPIFINGEKIYKKPSDHSAVCPSNIDDLMQDHATQNITGKGASKVVHQASNGATPEYRSKYPQNDEEEPPKKSKKGFTIVIIAIILLTVAVAAFGIFKKLSDKSESNSEESVGAESENSSDKSVSSGNSYESVSPDEQSNSDIIDDSSEAPNNSDALSSDSSDISDVSHTTSDNADTSEDTSDNTSGSTDDTSDNTSDNTENTSDTSSDGSEDASIDTSNDSEDTNNTTSDDADDTSSDNSTVPDGTDNVTSNYPNDDTQNGANDTNTADPNNPNDTNDNASDTSGGISSDNSNNSGTETPNTGFSKEDFDKAINSLPDPLKNLIQSITP